jgi:hypothetical protein
MPLCVPDNPENFGSDISNPLQYRLRKGIIQIYIYSVANAESCLIIFGMNKTLIDSVKEIFK